MNARTRLLQLLKMYALEKDNFTLSSGLQSNYYVDAKQVTLSQEGAKLTGKLILEAIEGLDIEAIGGPEIGAIPLVDAVLHIARERLSGFYVRKHPKEYGKRSWVEGPLKPGMRVAIVDDVATTGASLLRGIDIVAKECEAVAVIVLVDRLEGAAENLAKAGYQLLSIFTSRDI